MTTNEVLTRHNFITKVLLKSDNLEVSRELKVKIMKMRIEYSKIRRAFDDDVQEFIKGLSSDEIKELLTKPEKTDADNARLEELMNKINQDYSAYILERGKDEANCSNYTFTEEEYNEIIEVNVDNDVEINGTKIMAPDFLEILYSLFIN